MNWEVYTKNMLKAWANSLKQGLNKETNNMTKIDINKEEDNFILATETIDEHKVVGLHKHEGVYYGGLTMKDGGELYFRWNGRGELLKGFGISRITDWNLKSPIMKKPLVSSTKKEIDLNKPIRFTEMGRTWYPTLSQFEFKRKMSDSATRYVTPNIILTHGGMGFELTLNFDKWGCPEGETEPAIENFKPAWLL